ncbi:transposase IS4 family protein [Stanieria sp. NIES-3757]|nr:transposase IS4 family protein [Stanieria sp. NIES-3757]BAU64567.1 transposase IS4 family protein [Stanieria sp. NIES-3757]BAU65633.1 transposase IS4 family protein [Stanieria sp. NIES-3757]BAU65910.1 transposase IS4 family protein [Stanieria sp. NIES-3757]BAU66429.1 transposase IS4 family protein [Stanieria sp. NIES-3757]
MNQIILLRRTLKPLLGWHGARLNFLALFLIALLRVKTINLAELATGFRSNAKTESNYKRLQRFFRNFDLDYVVLAKAIVILMNIPQPWVLSIDRTEWSFGEKRFNVLLLGVVHNGVAYPLVWEMLEKKGNSNSDERMDLLERFCSIFPDVKVAYLTGDREFIGKPWLSYLLIEPTIRFRLRIRASDRINEGRKELRASIIFAHLQPGQTQVLSGKKLVWGRKVYVSALRLDNGELLIVITPDFCNTAISDYGQRWGIETLFGMFKTRGFCLESTHFNNSERLSKLLALMALALCWAVKTGEWLHQNYPIKIKKHGRLAKSIFRYGLDHLRSIVTDLDLKQNEFLFSLKFLSCT